MLFVVSPNGQQQCAGEYTPLENQTANDQPVYRQANGDYFLYSGTNGMWIIGGLELRDKGFDCAHGMLFCRTLHGGVSPDKISGVWSRLEGEGFVEDSGIKITTGFKPPSVLRVVSPNGQQKCAGEYHLVVGDAANGLPLWKQRAGKCWLYAGSNGCWVIGGSDAKDRDFKCARGVMYSKQPHGGVMPDKVGSVWLRLGAEKFHEDSSIAVTLKPPTLYVLSPNGQQRCAGEYNPIADRLVNGQPLWEHVGRKCWLYSGSNGMWIIGGDDAKAKDFNCTRGVIYCNTVHGGASPAKMPHLWLRLDGSSFREDAAISVSSEPGTLYVASPNGHHRCAGEYRLVGGEGFHGLPVWKQRSGTHKIYASKAGTWLIGSHDGKEPRAVLQCEKQHRGELPDKMGSSWMRRDGDGWQEDADIRVSTTLSKPAKLHIASPNGQQRCSGEYFLVAGTLANGQPLWRQMGGKYWLYSGTNGMWIIGSTGAKEKQFECSKGVIYSHTPHGGVMPDKVEGLWLRLDGDAFHEDETIKVGSDYAVRKRAAPE